MANVAATPTTVRQLRQLGYEVVVESGAGDRASFPDEGFVDGAVSCPVDVACRAISIKDLSDWQVASR